MAADKKWKSSRWARASLAESFAVLSVLRRGQRCYGIEGVRRLLCDFLLMPVSSAEVLPTLSPVAGRVITGDEEAEPSPIFFYDYRHFDQLCEHGTYTMGARWLCEKNAHWLTPGLHFRI